MPARPGAIRVWLSLYSVPADNSCRALPEGRSNAFAVSRNELRIVVVPFPHLHQSGSSGIQSHDAYPSSPLTGRFPFRARAARRLWRSWRGGRVGHSGFCRPYWQTFQRGRGSEPRGHARSEPACAQHARRPERGWGRRGSWRRLAARLDAPSGDPAPGDPAGDATR
jgi:hypothetical protein